MKLIWDIIAVLGLFLHNSTAKDVPRSQAGSIDLKGINTYQQVLEWLNTLKEDFSFVQVQSLGRSVENRSIWIVEIDPISWSRQTVRNSSDCTTSAVFLDAGTHGREQITVTVALALIRDVVDAVMRNESSYLTTVKWYIAPLVNPDGYEYSRTTARSWRKNRSTDLLGCTGVDLNRNWNFRWGIEEPRQSKEAVDTSASNRVYASVSWLFRSIMNPQNTVRQLGLVTPCSELFAGRSPFSEIESILLSQYILNLTQKSHERLESCFSLHSMTGGQQLLFPYGYTTEQIPDYDELKLLARDMTLEMDKVAGRRYQYGSVAETLYQTSGLQADWLYAVAGVNLTFVVEMHDNYRVGLTALISKAYGELYAALEVLVHYLKSKRTGP